MGRPAPAPTQGYGRSSSHGGSPLDRSPAPAPHDVELGSLERLGDSFSFGTVLADCVRDWGWKVQAHTLFAGGGWRAIATHNEHGSIDVVADSFAAASCLVFIEATRRHHRARRIAA